LRCGICRVQQQYEEYITATVALRKKCQSLKGAAGTKRKRLIVEYAAAKKKVDFGENFSYDTSRRAIAPIRICVPRQQVRFSVTPPIRNLEAGVALQIIYEMMQRFPM
jgi:hypothetical protein